MSLHAHLLGVGGKLDTSFPGAPFHFPSRPGILWGPRFRSPSTLSILGKVVLRWIRLMTPGFPPVCLRSVSAVGRNQVVSVKEHSGPSYLVYFLANDLVSRIILVRLSRNWTRSLPGRKEAAGTTALGFASDSVSSPRHTEIVPPRMWRRGEL